MILYGPRPEPPVSARQRRRLKRINKRATRAQQRLNAIMAPSSAEVAAYLGDDPYQPTPTIEPAPPAAETEIVYAPPPPAPLKPSWLDRIFGPRKPNGPRVVPGAGQATLGADPSLACLHDYLPSGYYLDGGVMLGQIDPETLAAIQGWAGQIGSIGTGIAQTAAATAGAQESQESTRWVLANWPLVVAGGIAVAALVWYVGARATGGQIARGLAR